MTHLKRNLRVLVSATAALFPLAVGSGSPLHAVAMCDSLPVTWEGTAGDDVHAGGSGADVLNGLGGNDHLDGGGGDDHICGGSGEDELNGESGDDRIFGDSGNDDIRGGPDTLPAGPGLTDE